MKSLLNIDSKYNQHLSRVFSNSVITDLVRIGKSSYLNEILSVSGLVKYLDYSITLEKFFDTLYDFLLKKYRNEYIYKNTIANKILLGRHSLNTTFMLVEFRAANCKADTVILNGTSNVYEIKTGLDSLYRLNRQIAAYEKIFDMIHVIASPTQVEKAIKTISQDVGLLELTPKNTIKQVRSATSRKHHVSPEVIFDSLRKDEYTSIIKTEFGYLPDVPNTRIYSECKRLFSSLNPEVAHSYMVKVLKKRGLNNELKNFILSVPKSLKAFAIHSNLSNNEKNHFLSILGYQLDIFLEPHRG